MTPNASRRRMAGIIAAAVLLSGTGLAGCGLATAVKKVSHSVSGDRSTIDAFTGKLQSGATTFEATYVTTGNSPATIVYAVQPPKALAFSDSPGGNSGADALHARIVANSSGEYYCSPPASGSRWTCEKLNAADAALRNEIFSFYTPSHWVAFLKDFSLAAGLAGDKISTSTMTLNGFSMNCVDFRTPGVTGTSTICTTSQGILGYVKVADGSTSFEIKSYSTSPPASLFRLPPGAKVTKAQTGTQ